MRPAVQQPISKDKNVMVQTRKYYLKNHYLTLKSKVKVTGRSLWYVTHRLMVMRPHTKYHWPISKETIIWPWGQRTRFHEGHYSTWHTAWWSYNHIPNIIDLSQDKNVMALTTKYYLKKHYLTLRSKVKVPRRSLQYATDRFMVMRPHTKYHWPISKETIIWPWGQRTRSHEGHCGTWHTTWWSYNHIPNIIDLSQDKNVMVQTRKYYLKNHYLTLRSKATVPGRSLWYMTHRLMVMHPYQISLTYLERNNYLILRSKDKVPRRSLQYVTHRLMVIQPHTKYHWPISRQKCYGPDNKILSKKTLFDLEVKGQGPTKVITVRDRPSYGHAPTYQISLTSLERNNYLTLRSKDKVPRRSLRYVTHRLMVIQPHTKYHWPISRQKCYGPDKKILFKLEAQVSLYRSPDINKSS
jgi:hypothetical protein